MTTSLLGRTAVRQSRVRMSSPLWGIRGWAIHKEIENCFIVVVVVAIAAVNASLLENKHTTCISTHFHMELHNKLSLLVSSKRFTVHKKKARHAMWNIL
jgi:hypothetical protein